MDASTTEPGTDTCHQNLNHDIAEFTALYETALENMAAREQASRNYLNESMQSFNEQISHIRAVLSDFEDIMTQAGAARWRLAAESAMRQGEQHAHTIAQATKHLQQVINQSCGRIDQVTIGAASRVADAAKSLRIEDMKRLTEESTQKVNRLSNHAIQRLQRSIKYLHWEKFAIAVSVALVVGIVGGLFMNDELPWETHKKVALERSLGQTLIKAWPNLSDAERQHIQQATRM